MGFRPDVTEVELPMQVVQPYPTTLKPSCSRSSSRFVLVRYSVTTFEPGARDVFTQGLDLRPFAAAFLATRPAATITAGFDVFVQLVIAAMRTAPSVSWNVSLPLLTAGVGVVPPRSSLTGSMSCSNLAAALRSGIRSCGRFGPARLGSTSPRSSTIVSLKLGRVCPRQRPCSFA